MIDRATNSTVGLVDFVEELPADGLPWIGLVIVDHPAQRQGLGSEALTTVIAGLGSASHPTVHMAVMEANAPCLTFAESIGFTAYDTATAATSRGTQSVILMELRLRRSERTTEGA